MRGLLAILLGVALPAAAQVASGTLSGTVRDASSTAVNGAKVTVADQTTGFERFTTTGAEGRFEFTELRSSVYQVTAEKPGFQTAVNSEVELAVSQHARLDFELVPGASGQSITVNERVSPVEADDASIGFHADSASLLRLPLLGRNVVSLMTLGPGAIPRHLGGFVSDEITDVQRARGAVGLNAPIHGARSTNNRYVLDGAFNTDSNAYVSVVTPPLESVQEMRVITTQAAAEFPQGGGGVMDVVTKAGGRQWHGSAFEMFRNEGADARNYFDDPALARPVLRNHQYGGSISGPALLPNTFFFATYEGVRAKRATSALSIVPDAALRGGDFSGANPIYDPLSLNASGLRAPFANQQIPTGRISPIARTFLDRYQPLPNRTGSGSNYLDATPSNDTFDSASGRLDHQFRNAGQLWGRYTINGERSRIAGIFPLLPTNQSVRAQQALIGYTQSHGRWLSETRFAFSRLRVFALPESAFQTDIAKELGVNGSSSDPFTWGLPLFITNNFNLRTDDPALPQTQRDNTWQFSQNVSLTANRHSLKMGFQWIGAHLNLRQSNLARGRLTFTGSLTAQNGDLGASGDGFADFLLGLPQISERSVGVSSAALKRGIWSGYVQDDWHIHRRVTLNLGVRYEYNSPFRSTGDPLLNLDYSRLPAAPSLVAVNRPVQPDRNDIAPRIGLAAQLGQGFVFRAGYGFFFSPEIATEIFDLARNGVRTEINSTDGTRPLLTIRDPFPQTATTGLPSYFGIDSHVRTPYLQQWNAGFQKAAKGVLLEATYVGTKGTHLGRFRRFNTPLHVETGENLAPRPGDLQSLRPFPQLGTIFQRQHISNSSFHSLELKAQRRFRAGLFLLASFALAKSIDDADSANPGQFASFGAQDERNLRLERGLSFFDVRKRVSMAATYRVPNPQRLRWLLRNWEMSGVAAIQDGTPVNPVYFFYDGANTGTPNRPNVVPGQSVTLPRDQRNSEQFFNPNAFSTPDPFTFGNAGRNIIPGPGNVVLDAAVARRFQLTERLGALLRVESFNFANHPNFGIPGPYPDFGPFFGKIFSTGEPRRFQFTLRFDF